MFKKILLSAAALSGLFLFASLRLLQATLSLHTRPVTIRVWSDYSYAYIFRTVYRDIKICN